MKSLKLIGLALLAVVAMGAFAVASASAEEGFLTGGSGTPTTATILGGESLLETSTKETIKCKELDDTSIKFSNDKTATGTLHWLGCKAEGLVPVNSEGDEGGVILANVTFLVCLDPKNSAGTLLDTMGVAGTVSGLKLIVPLTGTKIEVTGTALAAVLTTGEAKLFNVEFLGSAGEQTVKSCLQGEKTIEHSLLSKKNAEAFQLASENVAGGLIQFALATELMDK